MPAWTPSRIWPEGTECFILGGGPSLKGFHWPRLHGRKTVGCNSAFIHGSGICNICFFSDDKWFHHNENALQSFAGPVVTHNEYVPIDHPWVLRATRRDYGLYKDALGFGHNSGCGAINLALCLGAATVYLLGFDCKLGGQGESNWHTRTIEAPNAGVYPYFIEGFAAIARDLARVFPGARVINCTPDSAIPTAIFPYVPVDEVLP